MRRTMPARWGSCSRGTSSSSGDAPPSPPSSSCLRRRMRRRRGEEPSAMPDRYRAGHVRAMGRDSDSGARSGCGQLILVLGGASSGKSAFALQLAGEKARRAFVATAQPLDAEMGERIRRHRTLRGPSWETAEVPLKLAKWFRANETAYDSIVVDCVTLSLSNLRERRVPDARVPALAAKASH